MYTFKGTVELIDRDVNFCVYVPEEITDQPTPTKGSIYIEGLINQVPFIKRLRRYTEQPRQLYINLQTLKAANAKPGDEVSVSFEQRQPPAKPIFENHPLLAKRLAEEQLAEQFCKITFGKKQAILRYLNQIKSDTLREIWIDRIIAQLKSDDTKFIIPFKLN